MPNCTSSKAASRHVDAGFESPGAGSSSNTRSKRKAARMSVAELDLQPQSNLCRYKTGRCGNARVVKPNGALLLLCEFHRSQQNRTKKRSDMKYRQDRAKKRIVERESSDKALRSHAGKASDAVTAAESRRPKKSTRMHRHPRSERLKAFAELAQQSECEFSLKSPRKEHTASSFFVTSNSTPTSSSRWGSSQRRLFSQRSIHSSVLELQLEDADITVDHISRVGDIDAMSSVFPLCCITPLSTARRCREPLWQLDDMRLLEYFIL